MGAGAAAYASGGSYVTGGGAGFIPENSPVFAGDRVQLEVTARAQPNGELVGHFNLVHHAADGRVSGHLTGYVDCLAVTGTVAVVTGVITAGFDPFDVDPVGHRVSWRVADGNPDEFAVDVDFFSGHTIAPCTSDPVLTFTVEEGNFRVGG